MQGKLTFIASSALRKALALHYEKQDVMPSSSLQSNSEAKKYLHWCILLLYFCDRFTMICVPLNGLCDENTFTGFGKKS